MKKERQNKIELKKKQLTFADIRLNVLALPIGQCHLLKVKTQRGLLTLKAQEMGRPKRFAIKHFR